MLGKSVGALCTLIPVKKYPEEYFDSEDHRHVSEGDPVSIMDVYVSSAQRTGELLGTVSGCNGQLVIAGNIIQRKIAGDDVLIKFGNDNIIR